MSTAAPTILLVEDREDDILLTKRAFKKACLANPIQVVTNGEDAVNYLAGAGEFSDREKFPIPVLVLLDLKLPRKSGSEVLAWIRSQQGLKRLPVVVLTSSRESSDINRAYELGANSYLIKPVALDGLMEMVRALNAYWFIYNVQPEVEGQ